MGKIAKKCGLPTRDGFMMYLEAGFGGVANTMNIGLVRTLRMSCPMPLILRQFSNVLSVSESLKNNWVSYVTFPVGFRRGIYIPKLCNMKRILFTLLTLLPLMSFATGNQAVASGFDIRLSLANDDVKLSWTSTTPAKEFIVEVATDITETGDLDFEEIGRVTASSQNAFSFVDETEKTQGLRYYRVVQITFTDDEIVSDTRTANFQFKDHFVSSISASKDLNAIDVEISTQVAGPATFKLSGVTNALETAQTFLLHKGYNHFTIPVEPNAQLGTYLLSVTLNSDEQIVMLQKETISEMMVSDE